MGGCCSAERGRGINCGGCCFAGTCEGREGGSVNCPDVRTGKTCSHWNITQADVKRSQGAPQPTFSLRVASISVGEPVKK